MLIFLAIFALVVIGFGLLPAPHLNSLRGWLSIPIFLTGAAFLALSVVVTEGPSGARNVFLGIREALAETRDLFRDLFK